jgi:acyl carrier protein
MSDISNSSTGDVVRTFVEQKLLGGRKVEDDENLLLSGLVDSLGMMSLVAFLEREFSMSIPFDHVILENFMTIDAIETYVASRKA